MPYPLQYPTQYDSAEWTQAVVTGYDVSQQALFVHCKQPTHVIVRCDSAIIVYFSTSSKFGDIAAGAAGTAITVAANTAFELDLVFTSMLITTFASNTAVKIVFTQSNP